MVGRFFLALERVPRPALLGVAALFLCVIGVIDVVTGTEARFFIFYWLPTVGVAWYAGRRWGEAFAAYAALTWVIASQITVERHWNPLALTVWNTSINATSFVLAVVAAAKLRELYDHERKMARTDFTTGIANARALEETLALEIGRAQHAGETVSLAYLDVDNFKAVNDTLGHATGDTALVEIAATLKRELRSTDTVGRLGGDEFALLLPMTADDEARRVVARLQSRVAALAAERRWPISLSIGLVTCGAGAGSARELLDAADELMYRVKESGKASVLQGRLAAGRLEQLPPASG